MYSKNLLSVAALVFVLGGVSVIVSGFTITTTPSRSITSVSFLKASAASTSTSVSTIPNAAKNFEEDLQLTLQIILDHVQRSTTTSKDQFVQQMEEYKLIEKLELEQPNLKVIIDISVPYNAAALLAYENSNDKSSISFDNFKVQYELDAVASVIAKQKKSVAAPVPAAVEVAVIDVDISVPYDAAAMLAYESSDKSKSYIDFKIQYEHDSVASVIAKQKPTTVVAVAAAVAPVAADIDVSVPYDAAAMLAYEISEKSMTTFENFKKQYEINAIAMVVAKRKSNSLTPVVPAVAVAAAVAVPTPTPTTAPVVIASTSTSTSTDSVVSTTTDISVPYDAAALLAYEASDKSKSFIDFKLKYELQAVASVIAKKTTNQN